MSPWLVTVAAIAYVALLFAVAWFGDRHGEHPKLKAQWPTIYVFSLAVYCTSWTFYGGVGTAAAHGWTFLPIYLGPALVFLFFPGFVRRLIDTAQRDNATSIADFIANRYGKSRSVALIVTAIALFGALPYIALQLKSLGMSYAVLAQPESGGAAQAAGAPDETVFLIALALAAFAIVFGARRFDAAGRNRGLVIAVAAESAVKLAAFAAAGAFALVLLAGLPPDVAARGEARFAALFAAENLRFDFVTILLLSMGAIVCLPRQFYIGVLEARSSGDVLKARWPFALYLGLTAMIVVPITIASLAVLPAGTPADLFVLSLPLAEGADALALFVFIGGFSAATSMVIVATVALSIMISNDLIAPLLLRSSAVTQGADMGRLLLAARRIAIVAVVVLAYVYYRNVDRAEALATIGLIAFAAMVQFAPAMIGGLYWRRGTPDGARWGLGAGFLLWAYCLFIPSYLGESGIAAAGFTEAFGGLFHPYALFGVEGLDRLTHGVLWSLGVNAALYVGVSLLTARAAPDAEPSWRREGARFGAVSTLGELAALTERFVGPEAGRLAFAQFSFDRGRSFRPLDAIDGQAARLAERLIAGVIGAPSARVIMASALSGAALNVTDVVHLLDETNQELQFSRELLAATMNNLSQGVSVVDRDQRLIAWNDRYLELFEFPPGFIHVGRPIADVIRYNAERGECGPGEVEAQVERRIAAMKRCRPHAYERRRPNGTVLMTLGNPMPGGGYVTTFTDITAEKQAQAQLAEANERLEERVEERTAELSRANVELAREVDLNRRLAHELHRAKRAADEANQGKTKFLAAASHDLLQPLHAARLFSAALGDSIGGDAIASKALVDKIDRSIASADKLLRALLDISKLDAGGVKPSPTVFPIGSLLEELVLEFTPLAEEKGLTLRSRTDCDCAVYADRTLLRSVIQNLLGNAIRYTRRGGVLIGCRFKVGHVRVEVWDSGPGIPEAKLKEIFKEFTRLDATPGAEKGAGLGLAIAERSAALIDAKLSVRSKIGKGSVFSVDVPRAAGMCITVPSMPATQDVRLDLAGLSVLCVDNDAAILEGLGAMLDGWGCRTHLAPTFEEAVRLAKTERLDAALVDHQLDGPETGIEVLAALRKSRRTLEAALVTADPSPALRDAAGRLGARVLLKPVEPKELRAILAGSRRAP